MVKILVCDDDTSKLASIVQFIQSLGRSNLTLLTAKTMVEFTSQYDSDVDVCVIDIRIPAYEGAAAEQNGIGILQHIESVSSGNTRLVAISSFPDEFDSIRSKFEKHGCVLADYHKPDVWKSNLRMLVLQSTAQPKFDFLIFVALSKERSPYLGFDELNGNSETVDGLTRYDIKIGSRFGSIIELPRMGLVDASIVAAKCIDRFSPKLVAMSGICAGFSQRAEMGQLLVAETAYEYQTGKWTTDGFQTEPYQHSISENLRAIIRGIFEDASLMAELESGWTKTRPTETWQPKLSVFTSGSAVIADGTYMEQIAAHHRKVSGLDMEVFGLHRAAHLANVRPDVLCAKVVVDLADQNKDDRIQPYGCYVSCRFVLKAIEKYFAG